MRLFLFIDETGDHGHPSKSGSSRYYAFNIVVATRTGLRNISEHFSRFRYFHNAGKEFKNYTRNSQFKKFTDICEMLSTGGDVRFLSLFVDKEDYVDSYLRRIDKKKEEFDPKKFRNFIIKKTLEVLFDANSGVLDAEATKYEIEVVFNMFLHTKEEEKILINYLSNNYKLPNFFRIIQVDSQYSDAVQVADIVGRAVKKHFFDEKNNINVKGMHVFEIVSSGDKDEVKSKRGQSTR